VGAVFIAGSVVCNGGPRGLGAVRRMGQLSAAAQMTRYLPELGAAAEYAGSLHPRRIGVIEREETPEFAIWAITGAAEGRTELKSLNCAIPGQRPSADSVDVVISVTPLPPATLGCTGVASVSGWTWRKFTGDSVVWVGVAPIRGRARPVS
jgi:hypothetical protein